MIKEISDKVFYIGADNLESELFESQYSIPNGISYNSYVIRDKKTAIVDTIDIIKAKEWKNNLFEVLDGESPDYLIVHHMEPDHSALIAWTIEQFPKTKIVASQKAIQMLTQFFDTDIFEGRTMAVKEGDTLSLGKHNLRFFSAPMVHWPEVMVSFDETEGTLYSADGFGKFGALSKCGYYGKDDSNWKDEAKRYYFNIVGKYGIQVQNLLKKISSLPIRSIYPLHGPILDSNLEKYIALYDKWSKYEPEIDGVFIAVASIHGGTMATAEKLKEILIEKGMNDVIIRDLCRTDISENVSNAFTYSKIVLAAASYDAGLFTPMSDYLHRLKAKGLCNRKFALIENGSWAPCAAKIMTEYISSLKGVSVSENVVTIKSRLHSSDISVLEAFANSLL